ncbi:hypothetical protein K431DRAFT_284666 [Polychaeton citri CBS 116435]|uniref:Chitin biosynthesis protein n=1 Tax=Polychaeton citri CBS 116435 TaxID=1314669 RepID=A0A9P4Q6X9_9PEZI|nr:hypothetical protein K431DRAFT_284666 [Polychaeton citri CBS 116435]
MLVSLTVGKVDAGVAVLLTEDKRLIEFPSILLPPDIHSGSIVDIDVTRNARAEEIAESKFNQLQADILNTFGTRSPSPPVLRCRNATQTSVVLEWDPLQLASAELRSLSLFRNNVRVGVIPPGKQCTKISGLALDTEYSFHLVLRTSAGLYTSERLTIKTHRMEDLHGITITPGHMPEQLRESLEQTVERVGAKIATEIRIDTTHFICVEPRGQAWEKAKDMNIPVVVPDWLLGCEREGRIVGVRGYYLDADPKLRQMGPSMMGQGARGSISSLPQQVRESPRIEHTPPTPDRPRHERAGSSQLANGTSANANAAPPFQARPSVSPAQKAPSPPAATKVPVAQPAGEDAYSDDDESENGLTGDQDESVGETSDDDGDVHVPQLSQPVPPKPKEKPTEEAEAPASNKDGEVKGTTEPEAATPGDEEGKFDEVAL